MAPECPETFSMAVLCAAVINPRSNKSCDSVEIIDLFSNYMIRKLACCISIVFIYYNF